MIKTTHVTLPDDVHWKIKQKCRYYNITIQYVMGILLEKFSNGEFDEILNFPKDENK